MKNKLKKLFGIGPLGAVISVVLLIVFVLLEQIFSYPIFNSNNFIIKLFRFSLVTLLVFLGLGLHIWSFLTLRNWWKFDQLCTTEPFNYFRHPMYTAWITFICPGAVLYLNSYIYFLWIVLIHIVWHRLIKKEEIMMLGIFGDRYTNYSKQTGRFFPKLQK